MLLSIVSGTFNRLPYLRQFVASARACIPRGMAYEFVLVDGGSVDGTLDWCKEQADIHLIEHGELKGAIRAFTDAGNASRGEYCLMANDDILLHANSIIPALVRMLFVLDNLRTLGVAEMINNRLKTVILALVYVKYLVAHRRFWQYHAHGECRIV